MNCALYRGRVLHRRISPFEHRFVRRLYMTWLDLDELGTVFAGRWLWSTRRRAWSRFRREDHLGDPAEPLDRSVRRLVQERLGPRDLGPVRLLTNLRVAGLRMNPVSFFFCYAPDGETPEAVVAEVTNTPWDDRHCYVFDLRSARRDGRAYVLEHAKAFHVSPYMPLEQSYAWRISPPGERLAISIESRDASGQAVFEVGLSLRRIDLTTASMALALVGMPLMTLSIAVGIYWQALLLKLRGARFFPNPGRPEDDSWTTPSASRIRSSTSS